MEKLVDTDWQTLEPGKDLNDKIINNYLNILQRRSEECPKTKRVLSIKSQFFVRWDNDNKGYKNVERWFNKIDLLVADIVFFPLHIVGRTTSKGVKLKDHWVLLVARPKKRDIVAFDSLGNEHNTRMAQVQHLFKQETVRRKRKFEEHQWTTLNMLKTCPQQTNGYDCGVFLCHIADLLSRELPIKTITERTSQELRDSIKRKLKWYGKPLYQMKGKVNKPPPSKKLIRPPPPPPPLSSPLVPTEWVQSNREGYFRSSEETLEVVHATQYLEVVMNTETSPKIKSPDPLLDAMTEYIDEGPTPSSLFPPMTRPSPDTSAEDLAKLTLKSPTVTSDMETDDTTSQTDTEPKDVLKTANLESDEHLTLSLQESLLEIPAAEEAPINNSTAATRRPRGITYRKRVFTGDQKWIRVNAKKAKLLELGVMKPATHTSVNLDRQLQTLQKSLPPPDQRSEIDEAFARLIQQKLAKGHKIDQ